MRRVGIAETVLRFSPSIVCFDVRNWLVNVSPFIYLPPLLTVRGLFWVCAEGFYVGPMGAILDTPRHDLVAEEFLANGEFHYRQVVVRRQKILAPPCIWWVIRGGRILMSPDGVVLATRKELVSVGAWLTGSERCCCCYRRVRGASSSPPFLFSRLSYVGPVIMPSHKTRGCADDAGGM